MPMPPSPERRTRDLLRIALIHDVTIGLSAAFGLLLISGAVHLFLGAFAAAAASVGGPGSLFYCSAAQADRLRRSAFLVDKVLKGAKPADLPGEQATWFDCSST